MPLTKLEKERAKNELRSKINARKLYLFDYWLGLFEMDETARRHSGYSKGAEDMLQKLAKGWRQESAKLMAPFDRGDYDE